MQHFDFPVLQQHTHQSGMQSKFITLKTAIYYYTKETINNQWFINTSLYMHVKVLWGSFSTCLWKCHFATVILTNDNNRMHTKYLPNSRAQPFLRSWQSVSQMIRTFPAIYGTRRFSTVFVRAYHCSLSWARWIQFTSLHPISSGLHSSIFPSDFLICPMHATWSFPLPSSSYFLSLRSKYPSQQFVLTHPLLRIRDQGHMLY
jgi:hypothetical protein